MHGQYATSCHLDTVHDCFNQALARDGYRCMITGLYDTHSYDKFPEIKQEAMSYGRRIVVTNASHIFPASTNQGTSGEQERGWKV
jgi:hypothetical protein